MEFAYLDESGDPGEKGSKKMIMCLVCTREKKKLTKIIRKTKQRLLNKNKTAKWLNRRGGEIKFYSFPDKDLLIRTLKEIANLDIKIYYICLDKDGKKFDSKLKEMIIGNLFSHVLEKSNKIKPQKVISDLDFFGKIPSYFSLVDYTKTESIGKNGKIDGSGSQIKYKRINYEDYIESIKLKDKVCIKVEPLNSRISEELQAVDLICGSIFQHEENNNPKYFNIIKKKIGI